MTIQELINTLDAFRDEYNTSTDKEVQKLCGFIRNTIDGLQAYLQFFSNAKSHIETNKQYYSDSLESIKKLIETSTDGGTPGDETPGDTTES